MSTSTLYPPQQQLLYRTLSNQQAYGSNRAAYTYTTEVPQRRFTYYPPAYAPPVRTSSNSRIDSFYSTQPTYQPRYSDLLQMVDNHQIRQIRIQQPSPHSHQLPLALAETHGNRVVPVTLSPDTHEFSDRLEANRVPYSWETRPKSAKEMASDTVAIALEEVAIPLGLIAAGMGALGLWQSWLSKKQAQEEVHQVLSDYHKVPVANAPNRVDDILPLLRRCLNISIFSLQRKLQRAF